MSITSDTEQHTRVLCNRTAVFSTGSDTSAPRTPPLQPGSAVQFPRRANFLSDLRDSLGGVRRLARRGCLQELRDLGNGHFTEGAARHSGRVAAKSYETRVPNFLQIRQKQFFSSTQWSLDGVLAMWQLLMVVSGGRTNGRRKKAIVFNRWFFSRTCY